jgi:hypothetical protein
MLPLSLGRPTEGISLQWRACDEAPEAGAVTGDLEPRAPEKDPNLLKTEILGAFKFPAKREGGLWRRIGTAFAPVNGGRLTISANEIFLLPLTNHQLAFSSWRNNFEFIVPIWSTRVPQVEEGFEFRTDNASRIVNVEPNILGRNRESKNPVSKREDLESPRKTTKSSLKKMTNRNRVELEDASSKRDN